MSTLTIYAKQESVRLAYVLDWLFGEQLGVSYNVIHDADDLNSDKPCIAYGAQVDGVISIPDTGLLWDVGNINKDLRIDSGMWQQLPTIFAATDHEIPFDIFSAIFFLISRYEEYLPYTPDQHGRYPATESILYKEELLSRPIVDEWVATFHKILSEQFTTLRFSEKAFTFQPTYDIDIAWSYLYKGFVRTTGAYAKDVLKGRFGAVSERLRVVGKKENDPYDSFSWLQYLHRKYLLQPIYFILVAEKVSAYDKNINPDHPYMQALIKDLYKEGAIGIHPSYNANVDSKLARTEIRKLQGITGKNVFLSRQHYIRNVLPQAYQSLMNNQIFRDYSMGYGTHIGFRAGTSNSFLWYDLSKEQQTQLNVYPFCFMDTTAHYGEQLSVDDAFAKLKEMATVLQRLNAPMITVFHNFSLGSSKEWEGWHEAYEQFIKEL